LKPPFRHLLLLIVLLAAFLRLVALGSYPQRFNQDEMTLGYDAWSIWQTGHDQHGEPFPIQFRTFNDYVPPVATYLAAPVVGLLSLDETTTRLPFALMGIATVALVGLLGRRWFNPWAGLFAALLLTLNPWHLNYSRIAFPVSVVPFFTTLALYAFTRGLDSLTPTNNRPAFAWLALSALSFGLLTAAYSIMKLQAPLLLVICGLAAAGLFWRHRTIGLMWLLLYLLIISPIALDQLNRWELAQNRFNDISIFKQADWLPRFWENYRAYYDPVALFLTGLKEGIAVRPPGIGELFWLEAPLSLIGLLGLMQRRFWSWHRLLIPLIIILWGITFPISASLTNEGTPHEIRSYNLLPLPQFVAGYGLSLILTLRKPYRSLAFAALSLIVIIGLLFTWMQLTYFFNPSLLTTEQPGREVYENIGLRPVLQIVQSQARTCDLIWMETTGQQPYMYYIFLTRFSPQDFLQVATEKNTDLWLNIRWFNNIRFGTPWETTIAAPAPPPCDGLPARTFYITRRENLPAGWQDLILLRNDAGRLLWRAAVNPPASG